MATRRPGGRSSNTFFDEELDTIAEDANVSPAMTEKLDGFKGAMDNYNTLDTSFSSLSSFTLPFGAETQSIIGGIPAADQETAEEEGIWDDLFEELGVDDALAAVAGPLETFGGLVDNFSQLGDAIGDTATDMLDMRGKVNQILGDRKDSLEQITNFRDMLGLTADEVFGFGEKGLSEVRLGQLVDKFKLADEVTSITHDLAKGAPAISDFIDKKYPGLVENLPNVSEAVDGVISNITAPVADLVQTASVSIEDISTNYTGFKSMLGVASTTFEVAGNIMGNEEGESAGFLEKAMGSVDGLVSSATVGLQKDLFGNYPVVKDAVDFIKAPVESQIFNKLPNIAGVDNIVDTLVSYGSEYTLKVEQDIITPAIDEVNAVVAGLLPDREIPIYSEYDGDTGETVNPQSDFVVRATDAVTSELNTLYKGMTDIDPAEVLASAKEILNTNMDSILESVHTDASRYIEIYNAKIVEGGVEDPADPPVVPLTPESLLPDLPSMSTTIANEITGLDTTNVGIAIKDAILAIPTSDDLMGLYEDGFATSVQQSIDSVMNTILPELPDVVDVEDFLQSEAFDQIKDSVIPNIPNFPTGDTVRGLLDTVLDTEIGNFLNTSTFESIKSNLDVTKLDVDGLTDGFNSVVNGAESFLDTGISSLANNFDVASVLQSDIGQQVSNIMPSITSSLNNVLPSVQKNLPDVIGYLNTEAGPMMDSFRTNISALPIDASENLNNMLNWASNLDSIDAGKLSQAAGDMLKNVNLDAINIPSLQSLQMGMGIQNTMAGIEKIMGAQFSLDNLDKAKEMIPNIESAMESFNNFEWEGSGFSLGMISSYFTDADSADELKAIVTEQLVGAPPINACTKKMMGALTQANSAIADCEGKKAEALAAVETIKEIFDIF